MSHPSPPPSNTSESTLSPCPTDLSLSTLTATQPSLKHRERTRPSSTAQAQPDTERIARQRADTARRHATAINRGLFSECTELGTEINTELSRLRSFESNLSKHWGIFSIEAKEAWLMLVQTTGTIFLPSSSQSNTVQALNAQPDTQHQLADTAEEQMALTEIRKRNRGLQKEKKSRKRQLETLRYLARHADQLRLASESSLDSGGSDCAAADRLMALASVAVP